MNKVADDLQKARWNYPGKGKWGIAEGSEEGGTVYIICQGVYRRGYFRLSQGASPLVRPGMVHICAVFIVACRHRLAHNPLV